MTGQARAPKAAVAAVLGAILMGLSGCTLGGGPHAASHRTLTERPVRSALAAVVSGSVPAAALARLVAVTVRPGEEVAIIRAGPPAAVLVAATAPPPARVAVANAPAAPGAGATSFQQASYRRSLSGWRNAVARARRAVAARTRARLAAWTRGLGIAASVARSGPVPDSDPRATVAGESAVAANALVGLNQVAGAGFGDRRVVLLYASSLAGIIPPGELTGADVIVMTSAFPTAAAVGTAQAGLLAAGASRATILGPDTTTGQLAQLVAAGLSQKTVTETLSGAALFANDSSRLAPSAGRVLTPLIAPLRQPGAAAVINGYASMPGTSQANYLLSYSRAEAVAGFLEAGGVSASALVLVGHGASDLVAPGSSGANRRVVVVIEEPAAG